MNSIDPDILTSPRLRIGLLIFLSFLFYTVLAIQLWDMQVLHREEYRDKSRRQSVRTIRVPPVRGRILARNGEPLADNRLSHDAKLHLSELRARTVKKTVERIQRVIDEAAKRTGRPNTFTEEDIRHQMNYRPGVPMELFRDLGNAELAALCETLPALPGLEITREPLRSYPHDSVAAHLIGYVGQGDPRQADDRDDFFYYIAEPEGKDGLEKLYDERLRGAPGRKLAIVNSAGFVHEYMESEHVPARNGLDLGLTLDLRAQKACENVLSGRRGAAVILDADNGEILAMASSPSYPLSRFIPRIPSELYRSLREDPASPFLNRASAGSYMPGSIIKPLTALAILKAGISPDEIFECKGSVPYGYGSIKCMFNAVHGPVNMYDAIRRSCNCYFVSMGIRVGIDVLSRTYASAGIGSRTGFELYERSGVLPEDSARWNDAETAYVAFGQGRVEVTPLQAAVYAAAIANGGTRWKPFLVKHIYDTSQDGPPVSVFDAVPERNGRLDAAPEALAIVREGMRQVVNERGGSGGAARNSKLELYGKTGTADVSNREGKHKNTWFIGFGYDPNRKKTYSMAIMVEYGESGGRTAAPMARRILEQWLP